MKRVRATHNEHVRDPLVLDIPHAGREYRDEFRFDCDKTSLERTEDRFADTFYAPLMQVARSHVVAEFPRTYVDVNRPAQRRDLGVIRSTCLDGSVIRAAPLDDAEFEKRIRECHTPYFSALYDAVSECVQTFGFALHFNLHSFPSTRIEMHSRMREPIPHQIYIGDRHGMTADPRIGMDLTKQFQRAGFEAAYNDLFAGGHIVQTAATMFPGRVHSVQIEVRRDCYLDDDLKISGSRLRRNQERFVAAFLQAVSAMLDGGALESNYGVR